MIKPIESQVRDLQKELNEVQKEQAAFRLQPCTGDITIRNKEEKREDFTKRIRPLVESIRELERKRQEVISEPPEREGHESPFTCSSRKTGGRKNLRAGPFKIPLKIFGFTSENASWYKIL
jgi:hypothetical protein